MKFLEQLSKVDFIVIQNLQKFEFGRKQAIIVHENSKFTTYLTEIELDHKQMSYKNH